MRSHGTPYLISAFGTNAEAYHRLEQVSLKPAEGGEKFAEKWLQKLLHNHPDMLPIKQMEPGIVEPVAVCMELSLPHGFVDNLFVTPAGDIVVVETKLWRNYESRRKVIAQILDYAIDLTGLSYTALEAKIRQARKDPTRSLFEIVNSDASPDDEAAFVDAVSRNLRLGRMLLLIVGDGIQEEIEGIAAFMSAHIRLHFTLGLVELSLSRLPNNNDLVVHPRVIAKTVQIERAIIRVETGAAAGSKTQETDIDLVLPVEPRPRTISEEAFYEALAASDTTLPDRLKSLIQALQPLGVFPVFTKSMSLKAASPEGRHFQLGAVERTGRFNTESVNYTAKGVGRLDLGMRYQEALARLLPDGAIHRTPNEAMWRVGTGPLEEKPPIELLLKRLPEWTHAIADYVNALSRAIDEES